MPSGTRGLVLRKALITLQFVIASLLMICVLLINKQISFMKDQRNFGFETKQRMVLRISGKRPISGGRLQALKDEFAKHSTIEQVSASSTIPGREMRKMSMRKNDENWIKKRQINYLAVDEEFLSQYQIEPAAGRRLDKAMPTDFAGAFLINETAAKDLGWASPADALNKEIVVGNDQNVHPIVGVVKDFHYTGLQNAIEPLVLQHFLSNNARIGYFTLTVKTGDMPEMIRFVKNTWSGLFP